MGENDIPGPSGQVFRTFWKYLDIRDRVVCILIYDNGRDLWQCEFSEYAVIGYQCTPVRGWKEIFSYVPRNWQQCQERVELRARDIGFSHKAVDTMSVPRSVVNIMNGSLKWEDIPKTTFYWWHNKWYARNNKTFAVLRILVMISID